MVEIIQCPKLPRWIGTEAGRWAWHERTEWRSTAFNALSVQERTRLLHEAETLWNDANSSSLQFEELAQ